VKARLILGLALLAGAAACSDTTAPLVPAGPSYDSGHTLGSGGGIGAQPDATVSNDSSTQRGGHTLGGGA
jgi:hypothetical protein